MAATLSDLRTTPVPTPLVYGVGVILVIGAVVTANAGWLIGLAIFVPVVLGVFSRPQRGVILLAAVLPFDGMIRILGPAAAAPWKHVAIGGLLLLTFICPPAARSPIRRQVPVFVPWFLALLGLGLVSAFMVDVTTALVGLRLSFYSALLGLTVWRCPLDRRERDHVVTVFMGLALVTSLIGIWQQIVGHEYLYELGYPYNDTIRFTFGSTLRSFSTFNLPFPFGFYLMLAILIGLPVSLADPRRLRSKLFFASLPIVALGLLFSFVRGAMLGLAVGLLYLAFHRYKALVYGIPLVLVAAVFIPTGTNVTSAVFDTESLGVRTFSWGERFELFADHPLGTGIGTTGAAAEKAAKLKFQDPDNTYVPDNTWLKVMFELGVIGLWFFVMMVVSMFVYTRGVERRAPEPDRHFVNGVAAQLLAIMAAGLVATYLELAPMDQLFWMMIGIVATIAPEPAPGPPIAGEAARALAAGP